MEAFVSASFAQAGRSSFLPARNRSGLSAAQHATTAACPMRAVVRMADAEGGGQPTAVPTSTAPPSDIPGAKAGLFRLIEGLEMGAKILDDSAAQGEVDTAIVSLEALNPTMDPADHPLRAGRWRLLYTNSAIVLGRNRPGFARPQVGWQTLDMADGEAEGTIRNEEESTVLGGIKIRNQIIGKCRALKGTRIRLKFEKFTIANLFQVPFPGNVVGWQDQTFLDQEIRVARTHTGNVFVLKRDTSEP